MAARQKHVWGARQKHGWRARYNRWRSWLSTPGLPSQRRTNRSNICARRHGYAGGRREMDRQMPRERQDGARSLSSLRPNHTHFRSRHALGLSYCSNWPKKRHGERAKKLMDRLGATEWREPPIRPKNMQRRTFKRLEDELWDAWLRDASADLGVSLDRDALRTSGWRSWMISRISPSAEGSASRRINECHRGRPASHLYYTHRATCAKAQAAHRRGPRLLANRRLRRFRSGAVEKMTGDHPRNTGPMLSSLRCGAKTRSGKPCGSPAVAEESVAECMVVRRDQGLRAATRTR